MISALSSLESKAVEKPPRDYFVPDEEKGVRKVGENYRARPYLEGVLKSCDFYVEDRTQFMAREGGKYPHSR